MARVERLERVLEDDLDPAALVERSRARGPVQLVPVEDDPPGGRHVQAGDAAADRGLAAPGLADERDALARLDGERHAADGEVPRPARPVLDLEAGTSSSGAPPAAAGRGRAPPGPASASSSSSQRTHRTRCRPSLLELGHGGVAALLRERAPRRERAPAGHSPTPTATPGMPWSARGRRTSGMAPTSARVYGCRGREMTSSAGPFSTTRPAYMTTMRSAIRATTARSCETYTIAIPSSARSRESSVRCGPGSGRRARWSARRAPRPAVADARHRDRDTLLLAARELVRIAAAEAGIGPARPVRAPSAPSVGRRLRAVRAQHVHDRVADPKRRVEGAARSWARTRPPAPRRLRTARVSRPITDWPPTSIAPLG